MLVSHFLSTYNEETKLQREARETMSETSDINKAVDQINRAISSDNISLPASSNTNATTYKGNVCMNYCVNPHHPTYHFCGVSSKLYPAEECPFVLEPTLRDQYGAVNGYEPITVSLKWLSDATVFIDGHNNSAVNLNHSNTNADNDRRGSASSNGVKRRNTNIIGDIDKALKVLEHVDATMKKEGERALKEESRLKRTRSDNALK